jgi:hypothetical protein
VEPTTSCASHAERAATYRCDGCQRGLCDDCVKELGKLLVCAHCGEQALPLAGGAPATSTARAAERRRATSGHYGLGAALAYPFRGSGLFLFVAAVVSAGFVGFVGRFGIGCVPIVLSLGWLSLLVGIQFKIVATTARWDDELPDWPEYHSLGERAVELLTWLAIGALQWGPAVAWIVAFGGWELLAGEASPGFWIGLAALLWLGTALAVMAWGAAAVHWRHLAVRVDKHVAALAAAGGDGLATVNLTFVLLFVVLLCKGLLGRVPLAGTVVAGVLGIYWSFLFPHLVGLLFRRHGARLHAVYEG